MKEQNQQEQAAAKRQAALITEALERARNGGAFLNQDGKKAPAFYPKGTEVSSFNALMLALHSDSAGYRTNLYTLFSEARRNGASVETGERGVPFAWYTWNEYASRSNPDSRITRDEYDGLAEEQKAEWKPVRQREIRTLFNIDQTTLQAVDRAAYGMVVAEHGGREMRTHTEKDDKTLRSDINRLIAAVSQNLATVRKDGTGIAHYDTQKDIIHMPAQKAYPSYEEYVQEFLRKAVSATGHPLRAARPGLEMSGGSSPSEKAALREALVVELTSAIAMNRLGMTARIAPEHLQHIDSWQKELSASPALLAGLEADVNRATSMLLKAERGEKVEKATQVSEVESSADTLAAKVVMLPGDDGRWALYVKPEGEKGFAVYPDKEDVTRFFVTLKGGNDLLTERVRQDLAQKYYLLTNVNPSLKVDLFHSDATREDLSRIERVTIFKTKGDESHIMCIPRIEGAGTLRARELTQSQWQRMWIAEDRNEYKKHLAATLFADVLREKNEQVQEQAEKEQQEEKKRNSPEEKKKEEEKEKAKEELTKAETKAVAAVVLSPMLRQFMDLKKKHPDALLLFRCGDFYETYMQDAEKAASILGITLTKSSKSNDPEGKPLAMAGFPYHALDTYLPKLIRAGERVAICDQIEAPQRKEQAKEETVQQAPEEQQTEERSHGMHR